MSGNATWWMDPLGRGTYKGEWITKTLFTRFTEKMTGRGIAIYATPFKPIEIQAPRPDPTPTPPARETAMLTLQRGTQYPSLAVLRAGTKLYDDPSTSAGIVDTAKTNETFPYLGFPDDFNNWRMVVRQIPMSTGGPAQKVAYVHMNGIEGYVPNPAYPKGIETSERLKAVQALLDQLQRAVNG